MPKAPLLNREGKRIGEVDLPEIAFGIEPNAAIVHQYIETYLSNQRQGTHNTKTRSEASGGGRKPWRQKGTGRARVGSIRSPLWRHGAVTFGPKPRDYRKALPRKMRRLALASVLSASSAENAVYVFEDIDANMKKTSELVSLLKKSEIPDGKILLITYPLEPNIIRTSKNIPDIEVTFTGELNTYMALKADMILVTRGALPKIEELCTR